MPVSATRICIFFLLGLSLSACVSAQEISSQVRILYTGRLFGYYYANDNGPHGFTECPAQPDNPETFSRPATPFLNDVKNRPSNTVLLGTGDNFAPEIEARTFANLIPHEKEFYSWDYIQTNSWIPNGDVSGKLYDDMLAGKSFIPTDNVACFFRHAHYDAIVPGKHDFHFGAERLRLLARVLASPAADSEYSPVQMLGANIAIKTSWANDHEPVPEPFSPAKLGKQFNPIVPPALKALKLSVSDGKSVYPWLQYVDVPGTLPDGTHAYLVDVSGKDPYLPDTRLCPNSNKCSELYIQDDRKRIWFNLPADWKQHQHFSVLTPGLNYSLCLTDRPLSVTSVVGIMCTWFSVFKPFFLYPSTRPTPGSGTDGCHVQQDPPDAHCYTDPEPFLLKEPVGVESSSQGVAIFGVVDPEMESHIGQWNTLWIEVRSKRGAASPDDNNKYRTSVSFEDPVEALRQLMQYFNRKYCLDHSPAPSGAVAANHLCREHPETAFTGTKILLAEMSPAEAQSLSISINKKSTDLGKFAAIISSADDDYATRDQFRLTSPFNVLDAPEAQSASAEASPAFLVVPPQAWPFAKRSDPPASPLRSLQLFDVDGQSGFVVGDAHQSVPQIPELHSAVGARNQRSRLFMDPHTDDQFVQGRQQQIAEDWLKKLQPAAARANCLQLPSAASPSAFQVALNNFVLCTMQQKTRADIALIQKRDVYWPALKDPRTSAYDPQMLLNAILWKGDFMVVLAVPGGTLQKILKESDAFDQQDTNNLSLENERIRGLLTLGIVKDENKNFIVNDVPLDPGKLYTVVTTDYIASGDTGYPELADAVGAAKPQPQYGEAPLQLISAVVCRNIAPVNQCDPDLPPEDYFDQFIGNTPADPRQGNVLSARLKQWSAFQSHGKDPAASTSKPPSVESTVQNRPIWSLGFDKLNFGYGALYHSFSEANLNNFFGGVQATEVTSPRFINWSADEKLSLIRSYKLLDLFASQDLNYVAKFTATTNGPSKVSQSGDLLDFDMGMYFHRKGRHAPHYDFSAVFHNETQAFSPIQPLNVTPAVAGGTKTRNFDLGRTWTSLARLGPRYHNQNSYVEAGVEDGRDFNAIQAFQFVTPTGSPIGPPCFPTANNPLQSCVSNIPAVNTNSGLKLLRQNRARAGTYWHAFLSIPFLTNVKESLETQGDFFFNNKGNNSTDTRLRNLITEKLTFQVFPNLAFSPTYQVLFYENKVDERFLWQQQAMITVDFSFNLTNLIVHKTQLEYQRPPAK